jgi:hypothetical protein
MDPQSFIVGLMASITAFGGSILVAMIVLERPRYGLRCWPRLVSNGRLRLRFARQLFGQRTSQQWLEADDAQARSRERMVFERMQRGRAKRRRQGLARKHNPTNKA